MWDCENCGTSAIAGGVAVCPHCGAEHSAPTPNVSAGSAAQGDQDSDGNSAPDGSLPRAEPADTTQED